MARPPCALGRRFIRLAQRIPTAPAVIAPIGPPVLTRGELLARSLALAQRLHAAGGQPGDTAIVSLPNSPECIVAFLAARLTGLRVALVDASAPQRELERCASTVGAQLLLTAPQRQVSAQAVDGADVSIRPLHCDRLALPPATAVLKLTSGSTGLPQAVALSIRQVIADAVQIIRTMGLRQEDRTLAAIPLTHSYGFGSCLLPLLLLGIPVVFPTSNLPAALVAALRSAHITHFPAVPAMIRALAEVADVPPLPHLRLCLSAGAPLDPEDAAAFHARTGVKVRAFYGSSECGGITYDRTPAAVGGKGRVGTPLVRVKVEILDENGQPCPTGVEGRVCVTSPAVALGLVPSPRHSSPIVKRTFLTVDLGFLDEQQNLTLTGRITAALNVAGKKVHPEEVRRTLEALVGVRGAVVVGLPERHRGDLVAALVAVDPAAGLTVKRILAHCRAHLAPHKVPRRLVLVDALPTNERGKVQRKRVEAILRAGPRRSRR